MNNKLDEMSQALQTVGVPDAALADRDTAHLLVDAHQPLSVRDIPGVQLRLRRRLFGIIAEVNVSAGAKIHHPVHLCFGMFRQIGAQRVYLRVNIGDGASVRFLAHCLFARARRASHIMHARMHIGRDAQMVIEEAHMHGTTGGIRVKAEAHITLAPGARLFSDFSLLQGRVGILETDYTVDVADHALAELGVRVLGRAQDRIEIRDHVQLNGVDSRGIVKTRVALQDQASAVIYGTTEGNAAGARGHMDCTEIVKDQATGESVPVVRVNHPAAQVTHEAAIGTVDQTQLETLMAHGLTPEEAVELVISGLLRPEKQSQDTR
jgi:Fe-S cluster assembly scaffold protein SufB